MSLTTYLTQLLSDLRALKGQIPEKVDRRLFDPDMADVPDEMLDAETYLHSPIQGFPALFGVPAEAFPPPEQLTTDQMALLNEAIFALWEAWGIHADKRPDAPTELTYRVLTRYWREETIIYMPPSSGAYLGLELCPCNPDECEWGTYCTCNFGGEA